jgi:hypothetical protein
VPEILGNRSKRGAATAPFFFLRSQRSGTAVTFELIGIVSQVSGQKVWVVSVYMRGAVYLRVASDRRRTF